MPLRVVADPNVWVSALISPTGVPAAVLRAVLTGEITAVASPHLLDELGEVLARPRFRRWVATEDARAYVEQLAVHAEIRPDPSTPLRRSRDSDDDYLIALAEAANALVVTGDKDLLSLDLQPPALTPRELIDLLERRRPD
jgi:putative PIN family toxin of toxin-antitoxin system